MGQCKNTHAQRTFHNGHKRVAFEIPKGKAQTRELRKVGVMCAKTLVRGCHILLFCFLLVYPYSICSSAASSTSSSMVPPRARLLLLFRHSPPASTVWGFGGPVSRNQNYVACAKAIWERADCDLRRSLHLCCCCDCWRCHQATFTAAGTSTTSLPQQVG